MASRANNAAPGGILTPAQERERIGCPLCGNGEARSLFVSTDLMFGGSEHFAFVACANCRLYYQNPRPPVTTIASFYPDTYYSYHDPAEAQPVGHTWGSRDTPQLRLKAKLVSSRAGRQMYRALKAAKDSALRLCPGVPPHIRRGTPLRVAGRILDVGCGAGHYLDEIATAGWETWGLDISPEAVRIAADHGHRMVRGDLARVSLPESYFDVVRLWHTLEHVHHPSDVLRAARACLKPDGQLIIGVPNAQSLPAWGFGRHWMGWDIPRHMCCFTPRTLRQLVERSGFHCTGLWSYAMPITLGISIGWKSKRGINALDQLSPIARIACHWAAGLLTRVGLGDLMCLHAVPSLVVPLGS